MIETTQTHGSAPDPGRRRRGRISLLLIVALFLIPPIAAWVAWKALGAHGVDATTNAGTLITPARPLRMDGVHVAGGEPLTAAAVRGRWTYVMFAPSTCDQRCERQLYLTRQTRLAMNKDIPRVRRLLLLADRPDDAFERLLTRQHDDLRWAIADPQGQWRAQFRGDGFAPDGAQYFLVDPLGNLMMVYDLEVSPRGVRDDLRKLLKISQVG